jgi:short-subunit dehydrogenase
MQISGRTVLLTGATGGLGQAMARAFAGRGASVVLSGRRVDVLEPLAAEVGGRAVACDLADPADVDRLVAEAGDVDVLVANAALPASGRILSLGVEDIDRVLAVNLRAPIVLSRRLGEAMAARGSGHIVLVSSLAGKAASGGAAMYNATKFGLRGFGHALREDLRPHGVGVSVILPGFIRDAGMFSESGAKLPPGVGTKRPGDVAAGVLSAIERDRTEVEVAPLGLRLGTTLGSIAPGLSARVQRRLGGSRLADDMAEGQRSKR